MKRLLFLLAAVSLMSCAGTETGNPFVAELRVDAHSSDPAEVSVGTAEGGAVVTEAWLSIEGVQLAAEIGCEEEPDGAIDPPVLGVADHAAGGALLAELELPEGAYCRMVVPFRPAAAPLPAGAPPELEGNAVLLLGEVPGTPEPIPFRIASPLERDVDVRALAGSFEMSPEAGPVFLGFDVAAWLGGLDIAGAAAGGDGVIVIDPDQNADRLAEFEAAFEPGIELYRDLDGNGQVDPPDDDILARGTGP